MTSFSNNCPTSKHVFSLTKTANFFIKVQLTNSKYLGVVKWFSQNNRVQPVLKCGQCLSNGLMDDRLPEAGDSYLIDTLW